MGAAAVRRDTSLGGGGVTDCSAPRFLLRAPCSPIKSEFIRAKYQMLAFVHKLPCRDDDGVTAKDLSKVCGAPRQGTGPVLTHDAIPTES